MGIKVLYIGGTGEISYECVLASALAGHEVTVFNRGQSQEPLPPGVRTLLGEINDTSYLALGEGGFDVICQFLAYDVQQIQRDADIFGGRIGQYVYISTASAYQKPPRSWLITESTPLVNPHWNYSQQKADAEKLAFELHARGTFNVTAVRPSHTYRRRFASTFIAGDDHAWRMEHGRAVIVHGDGTALWAYTHASDFARPFVRLLGNPRALGEAFHIAQPDSYTWNDIFGAIARVLEVSANFVPVPTQTIARYNADWAAPLLGDKAWSVQFDPAKLQAAVGEVEYRVSLDEGLRRVLLYYRKRAPAYVPDPRLHDLLDRIARQQSLLGA